VRDVAEAVKARRSASGLTAAQLSAKTGVGKPLSRAVVSDLETGRKQTLDISELLTLAAALNVPPLSLLFPNVLVPVEVLPGVEMAGTDALGWFVGNGDARPGLPRRPLGMGDMAMVIAVRLVDVEKELRERRNAVHGPTSLRGDEMGSLAEDLASLTQRRVAALESERAELLRNYQQVIGQSDDA